MKGCTILPQLARKPVAWNKLVLLNNMLETTVYMNVNKLKELLAYLVLMNVRKHFCPDFGLKIFSRMT